MNLKNKLLLAAAVIIAVGGLLLTFWLNSRSGLPGLFKNVSPAVVWIGAELGPNDYEYYGDYELYRRRLKWQGTGFIISSDGLIATAGHIVENTKTFQLVFNDGRQGKARFVYREDSSLCDFGLIQVTWIQRKGFHILEWLNPKMIVDLIWSGTVPPEPIKNLPYVKFEDEYEIGDELVIIGYPWGLQKGSTLTHGIVSAVDRNIPFFGKKFVLHTDTPSWPGNSGSPVFNINGDVIGILIGGRRGWDNYSLCTPAAIAELSLVKYKAIKALEKAN